MCFEFLTCVSCVSPGVFFVYDLSPFMVSVTESTTPFFQFLTGLCAIVGASCYYPITTSNPITTPSLQHNSYPIMYVTATLPHHYNPTTTPPF